MCSVLLLGAGMSSYTCALIFSLKQVFDSILIEKSHNSAKGHFILINPVSYNLLSTLVPEVRPFLSQKGYPIFKHYVFEKGILLKAISFSESWIIDNAALKDFFYNSLIKKDGIENLDVNLDKRVDVTIDCRGKSYARTPEFPRYHFGDRHLIHVEVNTSLTASHESYFETTDKSWFYLAPVSGGNAVLQFVVPKYLEKPIPQLTQLIDETSKIKKLIKDYDELSVRSISIAPTFQALSLSETAYFTGEGLATYDPISGYGLLNAMRSAILCSAVIQSDVKKVLDRKEIMHYYLSRNIRALLEHLVSCIDIYNKLDSKIWSKEVYQMQLGARRLNGYLQRILYSKEFVLSEYEIKEIGIKNTNKSVQ